MADESVINAIVEHLLEGGIDTQLPADLLDQAVTLHVDYILDERHQTAKLAFDPTKAQLIAALGDDLLVITDNGTVLLLKEFVLAVETGRLATVTTKEGYTLDAPEILTDYGFAEDFTDAVLDIAPASGNDGAVAEQAVAESRFDDLSVEDLDPSGSAPTSPLAREDAARPPAEERPEPPPPQQEPDLAARTSITEADVEPDRSEPVSSGTQPSPDTETNPPDTSEDQPDMPTDDMPPPVEDPKDAPADDMSPPVEDPMDTPADDMSPPVEDPIDTPADDPTDEEPASEPNDTPSEDVPSDGMPMNDMPSDDTVPDPVIVEDREAETPTLLVTVEPGIEDVPLRLDIDAMLVDSDGSEALSVTVSGVPEGAALSAGSRDPATGDWNLAANDLEDLHFLPPENDASSVTLRITATATESASGATASRVEDAALSFTAVADAPDLSVEVGDPVLQTMSNFAGEAPFAWGVVIPFAIDGRLKDTDGSENLTIRIDNLPEGAILSTGVQERDGAVDLNLDDLDGLSIAVPFGTTRFDLTVTATASESGSDSTESVHRFVSIDPTNVSLPIVSFTNGNDEFDGSDDPLPLTADAQAGDDRITGTDGNDDIDGNAGDDTLFGGAGDDRLLGGAGRDVLDGGAGDDILDGGDGGDRLFGGSGRDTLMGGAGEDTLSGGDGDDTFILSGLEDAHDALDGGAGSDTLTTNRGDALTLHRFDPTNAIETIDAQDARLEGTDLDDTLDFSAVTFVDEDLPTEGEIAAGRGDDRVVGSSGSDRIFGGDGDDSLFGEDGDDTLQGDAGSDLLVGGDGDDVLIGGDGKDTLIGGEGDDNIILSGLHDEDDIIDGGAGYDTLTLAGDAPVVLGSFLPQYSIEAIDGGGDGIIAGSETNNRFDFSATEISGVRHIDAGGGVNRITGSRSDDVIFGGDSVDFLDGGDGDDFLDGGDGINRIDGGRGNDIIVSGGGRNILTGGEGGDTFVLGEGRNTVLDFDAEEGDKLDVSALVDIDADAPIEDYLKLEEDTRGNTTVLVNSEGDGDSAGFETAAFLRGASGLTLDSILSHGSSDDTTNA